jgi:hypothetical protein
VAHKQLALFLSDSRYILWQIIYHLFYRFHLGVLNIEIRVDLTNALYYSNWCRIIFVDEFDPILKFIFTWQQ